MIRVNQDRPEQQRFCARAAQVIFTPPSVHYDAKLQMVEALDEAARRPAVKAPKSAAGRRTISLSPALVAVLRQHRREQLELRAKLGQGRMPEDALVFPAGPDGGHKTPSVFSNRWARAAKRSGHPEITWH